ncbi:perlucin-like protein [Mytilus galloprovincialis]|uniref:perlucin-like protein n=1 Tax=Mytilus galloprovincialis TaxID=29158 RepID=UPI003F7BF8CA
MVAFTVLLVLALMVVQVCCLPCLSDKSKKIFEKTKKTLDGLEKELEKKEWKTYKDHCYYFGGDPETWFTAEKKCRQIGGYLVKIDDSSENVWLKTQFSKNAHYWIGLTDLREGEFRWSYDQEKAKFTSWNSKEPNNYGGNEDCAGHYNNVDTWFDSSCLTSLNWICERNFCN